jgi:hypothetical protein
VAQNIRAESYITNPNQKLEVNEIGLADPLFTGDVFHPTGTWVSANVVAGGGVTLANNKYFIPVSIRSHIKDVAASIATLRQYIQVQAQTDAAQQALNKAKEIMPDDVATPAFVNMYNACYYLKQADDNIDSAESLVALSDPFSLDE